MAREIVTQVPTIVPRLMRGAVELHCHVDPEFHGGYRSVNALELARELKAHGMRAAVVKSISLPSTSLAYIVNQVEPDFTLFGSIVLNNCVGGLNPAAVAHALRQGDGARIVWMPSLDAKQHIEFFRGRGHVSAFYHTTPPERAITILDGKKVKPEVREILRLIAQAKRCLATGHISPEESLAVVEAAREEGVERIIVTHPTWAVVNMSEEVMDRLVKMGAYLEHCFAMCEMHMWVFHKIELTPLDVYVRLIKTFGAEHTVISTDSGNYDLPRPGEAMRVYLACLLEHGVSEAELELMVKKNPYILLGLSEGKEDSVVDRKNLNPASLKAIPAPVSHGVAVSAKRHVYVSGQVPVDKDGGVVGGGDITAQTHQVMRNIKAVLEDAGATFEDVVKIGMYLIRVGDLPTVIKVRSEYLGENKPAATAVGVQALAKPEFLIEIEAVAVIG